MALEVAPVKVLGSAVSLTSKHALEVAETKQESLRIWRDARPAVASPSVAAPIEPVHGDRLTISKEALEAYNNTPAQAADTSAIAVDAEFFGLTPDDRLLILILEKALGIRIRTADQIKKAAKGSGKGFADRVQEAIAAAQKQAEALKEAATAPSKAGWGFIYERHESHMETEALSFKANGIVNTADGKQIAIQLQFNMSRSFAATSSLTIRGGDAKVVDPLVINYDGPAADFKDTTFVFDLDADGQNDEIAVLGSGSGYLAIDKNGDGTINNGAELFGPTTGNGYGELRLLDSDGNQWLDASDPAFDSVRIWNRDSSGADHLIALGQKGIGAIYVGSVGAQFSVKDASNTLQAQNTRMGIYVKESGQAGTIQEVDLVARPQSTTQT